MRLTLPVLLLAASASWAGPEKVAIRGNAICLSAEGKPSSSEDDCTMENGFVFQSHEGKEYRLSASDPRVEMLTDPRVRHQELEIEGWLKDSGDVEIVKLYSIKDGDRYDPHYFCATCNITAHTPGLCWCCRQPFEFRETPVPAKTR